MFSGIEQEHHLVMTSTKFNRSLTPESRATIQRMLRDEINRLTAAIAASPSYDWTLIHLRRQAIAALGEVN